MAIITGKWQWKSEIDNDAIKLANVNITFISNNTTYTSMDGYYGTGWAGLQYCNANGYITVGENNQPNDPIIVMEEYRIMDFGSEKQEVSDLAYEYIKSNAILLAPDLSFLTNVTMNHDLSVLGSLSISGGIKGISAKDVGTYSATEIDKKLLADYKVGDEKVYSNQTKTGFFVQNNFKETKADGWLSDDGYIQTSWPSIRYDYSNLKPKSLILGEGGEGLPDREGMYYANRSELTHTENALDIFHTSFDIEGGVQLKLAHNKILGELADWEGVGGQNLFTATADGFEAPSFKTSGTITIGSTTLNEEQLIKILNFEDSYTKEEIDAKFGNIDTALDSIIAIQESLIGGNT